MLPDRLACIATLIVVALWHMEPIECVDKMDMPNPTMDKDRGVVLYERGNITALITMTFL